jgi:ABC-2 type transport system ATP-binding protein
MISIDVHNLIKIFREPKTGREIRAVDDVGFTINSGEIFGFLGPNGAGKTTILRILAGLYAPTSGTVKVLGENVRKLGDRVRKQIGFLTENHGNYENLTVKENLKFFGGFYEIPDVDARINEILDQLNIADRKNMQVAKLSKGLKQRVAIARVLLPNPGFFFLDEPTSGLDPEAALELRGLIQTLKSENRTIIINSHNLEEVQKDCDRVAVLNKGKIVQVGTAAELSEKLFGTQELKVTFKGVVPDDLGTQLQANGFVKHVTLEDNCVTIRLQDVQENGPEVVDILQASGLKLVEITRVKHSLEDVYLKLMTNQEKSVEGWN